MFVMICLRVCNELVLAINKFIMTEEQYNKMMEFLESIDHSLSEVDSRLSTIEMNTSSSDNTEVIDVLKDILRELKTN